MYFCWMKNLDFLQGMMESRRETGLGDGMMCCCWVYGHWDVFLLDENLDFLQEMLESQRGIGLGETCDWMSGVKT